MGERDIHYRLSLLRMYFGSANGLTTENISDHQVFALAGKISVQRHSAIQASIVLWTLALASYFFMLSQIQNCITSNALRAYHLTKQLCEKKKGNSLTSMCWSLIGARILASRCSLGSSFPTLSHAMLHNPRVAHNIVQWDSLLRV